MMPLFLVTCLIDEGMYASNFRVIEAPSREAMAAHILANIPLWERELRSSVFYDWVHDPTVGPVKELDEWGRPRLNWRDDVDLYEQLFTAWLLTLSPVELLIWIANTHVDGDSQAQLAIHEIVSIEKTNEPSDGIPSHMARLEN
jgi:hypothetical protein